MKGSLDALLDSNKSTLLQSTTLFVVKRNKILIPNCSELQKRLRLNPSDENGS